jgi:hypothetical protein
MLNNKDLWMDGIEVMKRLKKKAKNIKVSPSKKVSPISQTDIT